jgi:hypothetical protein
MEEEEEEENIDNETGNGMEAPQVYSTVPS